MKPPVIASVLLHLFLPRRDRQMLAGDLMEEHALVAAASSPSKASRWYWGQVLRSAPTLVWANIRRGVWLKTLGAMLAGYTAVVVGVVLTDMALARMSIANPTLYSLASLETGALVMLAGGYLAASIQPTAARALAGFSALTGCISLAGTGDAAPLWYQLALIVVGPVAALAGGRWRNRGVNA